MGMDLYFNKQQALAAGLEVRQGLPRGTDEEITEAEMRGDPDYLEYLRECPVYLCVPNAEHHVEIDTCEDNFTVRANPWGPTYAPLTQFLQQHNITWIEA